MAGNTRVEATRAGLGSYPRPKLESQTAFSLSNEHIFKYTTIQSRKLLKENFLYWTNWTESRRPLG
jgi:hypothetical protein